MMFGIRSGLLQNKSKVRLECALWCCDWKQLSCLPELSHWTGTCESLQLNTPVLVLDSKGSWWPKLLVSGCVVTSP